MHIASRFNGCSAATYSAPRQFGCGGPAQDRGAGPAGTTGGLLGFASMVGRNDRLAAQWQALGEPLRGPEPFQPTAPFLPTTEMSKGQSLQNGRTSVSVDGQGNLSASTAPAWPPSSPSSGGGGEPNFLESFLAGFLSALGVGPQGQQQQSSGGCRQQSEPDAPQQPPGGEAGGQAGPAGLRVEGGHIILANGKRVPFGNTGAIIQMPDGTKVGVGRNSETDTQHVRWVTAGPGQEIPTNPPGKTNLFTLDAEGNLSPSGVQ